jgi:hypothetical protein
MPFASNELLEHLRRGARIPGGGGTVGGPLNIRSGWIHWPLHGALRGKRKRRSLPRDAQKKAADLD